MSTPAMQMPAAPAPAPATPAPVVPAPDPLENVSFDDIFTQQEPAAPAPPAAAPEPAAPYLGQWNTRAEAEAALGQIQQVIAQQQQALAYYQAQAQPQAPPAPTQQYQTAAQALEATVSGRDPAAFQSHVSQQARQEAQQMLQQALGPLAPLIQHANMGRALEVASSAPGWGDPNIPAFRRSPNFGTALKNYPGLADALRQAESNPAYAWQLPELYGLAFMAAGKAPQVAAPRTPPATAGSPMQLVPRAPTAPSAAAPAAPGQSVWDHPALNQPLDTFFQRPSGYRFPE